MVLLWGDVTDACRAGLSCPVLTFDQVHCTWAILSPAIPVCSAYTAFIWNRPSTTFFARLGCR